MGHLNQFRIWIKLNQTHVYMCKCSTRGCKLDPWVKPRVSLEQVACKQLVWFLCGLSTAQWSCQYSRYVVQPLSHRSAL